ncbi:hypothetical protein [Phenylobacterium sp.]|uniref:hypothetical protein n=1 Tax=Phenylobacterium sp. TaxID=1871053 RepID=UPI002DF1B4CF|nr:hypothetical protein [Phenylobacterium sp.]
MLRLLLSLGLAALALTLAGGGYIWSMDESRRLKRSLTRVLGEPAHALLIARGRGKAVGFNFTTNQLAVSWDTGAWCLIYRVEELVGAELIVDGRVLARVYRGETRRALDVMTGADAQVRLRLVFDDLRHPDFVMDLWLPQDDGRKGAMSAPESVQEANRWLARFEAVLRRPLPRRDPPLADPPPIPPPIPPVVPPSPPAGLERAPWDPDIDDDAYQAEDEHDDDAIT